MKPRILFVDDERYFTDRYVMHLSEEFEVIRCESARDAICYFRGASDLQLIILDIMMPTPDGVATSATDDGMDTGLWVLRELKDELQSRKIPVVVFTNRRDLDGIRDRVKEMQIRDGLVLVRTKRSKSARELPSIAKDHLRAFRDKGLCTI